MRNYLVFENKKLIPFQYPEDRDLEVGTILEVEIVLSRDLMQSVTTKVKVKIIKIKKEENKNRILYYTEKFR